MWGQGEAPPPHSEAPPPHPEAPPPHSEAPPPGGVHQTLSSLQEQMAAQQSLIGNLRGKVSSGKQQDYATQLAAMRSRLTRPHGKAKQQQQQQQQGSSDEGQAIHTESVSVEPGVTPFEVVHKPLGGAFGGSMQDIADLGASSASMDLGGSMSDVRYGRPPSDQLTSSQSKMNLLRERMGEDRSKFERQQRDNRENKENMERMKKKVEMLLKEVEEKNEMVENFQKGFTPLDHQATAQQLCQQLVQKDAIVKGLSMRVSELEKTCQEQKESLEEKECLLSAKTEAVSLVTRDRDEKMLVTMSQMDEKEQTIMDMRKDFVLKEKEWENERSSLAKTVSQQTDRVAVLEENSRRMETIRFDLSTRNAELQERLVQMQDQSKNLQTQLEKAKAASKDNTDVVEDLKRKLCSAESHGAKKLRTFEKQLKAIKSGDGGKSAGERILQMTNQIAELEEEKGNLQLKLVDFDEAKSNISTLENELEDFKLKFTNANQSLDDYLASVSNLEQEKAELTKLLNDRDLKLLDLEGNIVKFEEENASMNALKDELEKTVNDLNDKVQCLEAERDNFEQSVSKNIEETNKVNELRKALDLVTTQVQQLEETNERLESEALDLKSSFKKADIERNETVEANKRLMSILANKEDSLTNQAIEIDKYCEKISVYNTDIIELKESIARHKIERDNSASTYRIEVSKLDDVIRDKSKEFDNLMKTFDDNKALLNETLMEAHDLRQSMASLQNTISVKEASLNAQKQEQDRLLRKINEDEKLIESLENNVSSLDNLVKEDSQKLTELTSAKEGLESQLMQAKSDCVEKDNHCEDVKYQLSAKQTELDKMNKEFSNLNQSYEVCKLELEEKLKQIDELTLQKDSLIAEREELLKTLQSSHEALENEKSRSNELETNIVELKKERDDIKNQLEASLVELEEYKANMDVLKSESVGLCQTISDLKSEKDAMVLKCQEYEATVAEQQTTVDQLRGNIEQVSHEINEKHSCLLQKDQELASLREELNCKVSDLDEAEAKLRQQEIDAEVLLKDSIESEGKSWNEKLQESLSTKSLELEQLGKLINEKEIQLTAVTTEMEMKCSELATSNHQLSELQKEADSMKQSNEEASQSFQQQLQAKELQLTEAHQYHLQTQGRITELETYIQQQVAEREQISNEAVQFQSESQSRLAGLEAQIQEHLSEKQQLIEVSQSEKASYEAALSDLQSKLSELEMASTDASNLGAEKQKIQEDLVQLQIEKGTLDEKLSAIEMEKQILQGQVNDLMTGKQVLGEQLAALQEEKLSFEQNFTKTQTELSSLNEQLTEASTIEQKMALVEEEKQKLQSEYDALKQYYDQMLVCQAEWEEYGKGAEQEKTAYQANIAELTQKVNENYESINLLTQEKNALNESLSKQGYDIEEKLRMIESSSAVQVSLEHRISALEQELNSAKQMCSEMNLNIAENSTLCERIQEIGSQLTSSACELRSVREELTACQLRRDELIESVEAKHEQLRAFEERAAEERGSDSRSSSRQSDSDDGTKLSLSAQLDEARMTISLLQTSLATATAADSGRETREEELGEIDLRDPTCMTPPERKVSPEVLRLQRSLAERNDLIEQMQEQLRTLKQASYSQERQVALAEEQVKKTQAGYDEKVNMCDRFENQLKDNLKLLEASKALEGRLEEKISELNNKCLQASDLHQKEINDLKNENERSIQLLQKEKDTVISLQTTIQQLNSELEQQRYQVQQLESQKQMEQGSPQSVDPANSTELEQVKYKLSWYEQQWASFTQHYQTLQQSYAEAEHKIAHLQSLVDAQHVEASTVAADGASSSQTLENQEVQATEQALEIVNLQSSFDTAPENEQSQASTQLLQSQSSETVGDLAPQQSEDQNVASSQLSQEQQLATSQEVQRLRSELQRLQEASADTRSSELEALLQGAEAEIARLREAVLAQESPDSTALQAQQQQQLESLQRECGVLRCEVEVLEGENSRRSTDIQILEEELRGASAERDRSLQAERRLTEEREGLERQLREALEERERIKGELSECQFARDDAFAKISHLQSLLESSNAELNKYIENAHTAVAASGESPNKERVQEKSSFSLSEADDDGGWGKAEDFMPQDSSGEVNELKLRVIDLEKERNALSDELQASKVKCGKLLQKLKAAQTKNETLQKEVGKGSKTSFDGLDEAIEQEYKSQVKHAQGERDELKQKLEDVLREKDQLGRQCEVLRDGHESFLEMKEAQELELRRLTARNAQLEESASSMEWRISELEEMAEGGPREAPAEEGGRELKDQVVALESQLDELSSTNMKIEGLNNDLNARIAELEKANEELSLAQRSAENSAENSGESAKVSSVGDVESYKEVYMSLQRQYENLVDQNSGLQERYQELYYDKTSLAAAYNSIYSEMADLERELSVSRMELAEKIAENDNLGVNVESLTVMLDSFRNDSLEEVVKVLDDQVSQAKATAEALREEMAKHVAESESKDGVIEKLERSVDLAHGEQERLAARIADLKHAETTLTAELKRVSRQEHYSQAELSASSATAERLKRDVTRLREQSEHWRGQCEALSKELSGQRAGGGPAGAGSSELQAALAALHARDLRCHSLVLEINKLVEERDALQLQLSAALVKLSPLTPPHPTAPPHATTPAHAAAPPHSPTQQEASPSAVPSPIIEDEAPLKDKLALLHTFSSSVQQHTLAAAPPPPPPLHPPAPSLMDWILGRGNPDVVNI